MSNWVVKMTQTHQGHTGMALGGFTRRMKDSLGLAVIGEAAGLATGLCALDILRQLKKRVATVQPG